MLSSYFIKKSTIIPFIEMLLLCYYKHLVKINRQPGYLGTPAIFESQPSFKSGSLELLYIKKISCIVYFVIIILYCIVELTSRSFYDF